MWNIMKAQNYQTRGDNLVIYAMLIGFLLPIVCILMEMDGDFSQLTGGLVLAKIGQAVSIIFGMVFVILVSRICGWDATDKTMNYEIMTGHSRAEVYFGRVVVSLLWSLITAIAIVALPVMGFTLMNGWGQNMNCMDGIIRVLLALFPLFRLACEFALLTFLLQNCFKAMLIEWVLFELGVMGSMLYQEFTDKLLTVQLASSNLFWVFDFSNYRMEYIDGEEIPVFISGISTSMLISTFFVSLLVGGICLFAGYVMFKKQDMN